MQNRLNIHQMLKTFHKIVEHGHKSGHQYRLNGVTASSDLDGYTVYLSDDKVTLTIFFHNKYDLSAGNKFDEMAFFEKLKVIEKTPFH